MNVLKILICDDSLLVRNKLKESIGQCGNFEILEAADGQAAIDVYKANKPHVVFMDIVMPVRTGIEALKEIKEFDKGAFVVMLSSVGTQANLKEAIKAGASDFIQKPWEQRMIIEIIAKYVKEREGKNV